VLLRFEYSDRLLVIRVNESGAWKIAADRNVSRTHAAR
jgi:hypothetical protein